MCFSNAISQAFLFVKKKKKKKYFCGDDKYFNYSSLSRYCSTRDHSAFCVISRVFLIFHVQAGQAPHECLESPQTSPMEQPMCGQPDQTYIPVSSRCLNSTGMLKTHFICRNLHVNTYSQTSQSKAEMHQWSCLLVYSG